MCFVRVVDSDPHFFPTTRYWQRPVSTRARYPYCSSRATGAESFGSGAGNRVRRRSEAEGIATGGRTRRTTTAMVMAMNGGDDSGVGGTLPQPKDIFDALMAGDYAGVDEYIDAGGDCSVKDTIGVFCS